MALICDTSSIDLSDLPQSIRTPLIYKLLIKCFW